MCGLDIRAQTVPFTLSCGRPPPMSPLRSTALDEHSFVLLVLVCAGASYPCEATSAWRAEAAPPMT